MVTLKIILTIICYWVLMGVSVALMMALFYGLALVLGELAEWLRQRFAKPSLRK
jgi:type VI protein secretion system component VasF